MLTLSLSTPTLLVEQGFAGFSAAASRLFDRSATTLRQPYAPCSSLAVHAQFKFRFAAIRWPDDRRNSLFSGARIVQRLPGASTSRSRPLEKRRTAPSAARRGAPVARRLAVRFPAWRACRSAPPGLGQCLITGPDANSEFRRVSSRFAERAYRMAFSLASNVSSWRFLNG